MLPSPPVQVQGPSTSTSIERAPSSARRRSARSSIAASVSGAVPVHPRISSRRSGLSHAGFGLIRAPMMRRVVFGWPAPWRGSSAGSSAGDASTASTACRWPSSSWPNRYRSMHDAASRTCSGPTWTTSVWSIDIPQTMTVDASQIPSVFPRLVARHPTCFGSKSRSISLGRPRATKVIRSRVPLCPPPEKSRLPAPSYISFSIGTLSWPPDSLTAWEIAALAPSVCNVRSNCFRNACLPLRQARASFAPGESSPRPRLVIVRAIPACASAPRRRARSAPPRRGRRRGPARSCPPIRGTPAWPRSGTWS